MVLTLKTAHIPDKVLPTTWELLFRSSHRQSGFPGGASGKNPPASTGDIRDRFNLGLGRSPAEGRGNPLQYSCLENPVDRRAWWATVHRVSKSWTRLNGLACTKKHATAFHFEALPYFVLYLIFKLGVLHQLTFSLQPL